VAGPDQADIVDVVLTGQPATPDDWAAAGLPVPPPSPTPPGAALVMNTAAAREVGIPAGGAVGTAADVALLYQALLHNTRGLWDAGVLADGTGTIRNTHPDTERWGIPANRTRGLVVRGDDDGAHWRMHFGPTTSPATFGHDGAGGQIAWADPATGVSFCYLTNGMEANRVTELLRCQRISEAAGTVAAALA
jgi:CubicO group peptidase (beta-lactamase class C family)